MNKEKDNIEEFIKLNREEIDHKTPPEGLWANISNELDNEEDQNKSQNWTYYLKRIAAILIIGTMSIVTYEYFRPNDSSDFNMVLNEVESDSSNLRIPTEIREAEKFYSHQIDEKYNELKKYTVDYPELSHDIQADMDELDVAYNELKNDLKEEVASEEILEAMIQNYRIKLDILDEMLSQLKSINKTEENENTDKKS